MKNTFTICALLSFSLVLFSFRGKVVGVSDGDTITVLKQDNSTVRVRLSAIDCPETGQDFGAKARAATSQLCFGKSVDVDSSGTDQYGRVLGFVYVDGLCINKELLRLGLAWHYKRYDSSQELANLEATARKEGKGLWSQQNPVSPWNYRHK